MQRLYLDCDGVLADFDGAFTALYETPPYLMLDGVRQAEAWHDLQKEHPTFYGTLPLMPGAHALVNAVRPFRPVILSAAPEEGWAEQHKLAWARKHFPDIPMVITPAKNKSAYCLAGDILVDDYPKYRDLWEARGGHFVVHRTVTESIDQVYRWWGNP